jgi:hypothetical protein
VLLEHLLDLRRVDVHAARDDRVRAAIDEVHVSVAVDATDVAEGERAVLPVDPGGLLGIAVVLEDPRPGPVAGIEETRLAGRQTASLLVDGEDLVTWHGPADGARVREPVGGVDERADASLGAPPVLDEPLAPPGDHAPLDAGRDRGGAVQHEVEPRCGEALADLGRKPQQPHEHRGHHVRVPHLALPDQLERVLLLPARHDHDRRAIRVVVDREEQRRRVVERPGHEVRAAAVEAEGRASRAGVREPLGQRGGTPSLHAPGPAGGAARVDHRAAGGSRGIRRSVGSR